MINQQITAYNMFLETLENMTLNSLANKLYVHKGTINRWLETEYVPNDYKMDLNRLLGNKYNISSSHKEKDQYFTTPKISSYCYEKTKQVMDSLNINYEKYTFIEPSAGCCSFYKALPKNNRIGIDIEPKGDLKNELITSNYLDYVPKKGNYIVMGNPPFGLRGNLALRFINHSYDFADVVAFILPPLFNSTGKGVPMGRVKRYKLAHSEKLPLNSFQYPDGTEVQVATIFQVWTKLNTDKIKQQSLKTCKSIAKVYSLSDGGKPSNTRNKKMLNKCDVYLPSTCFNGMQAYQNFEELPNRRGYGVVFYNHVRELKNIFLHHIDWQQVAFKSTNSALNLRTDLIESQITKAGYYDK